MVSICVRCLYDANARVRVRQSDGTFRWLTLREYHAGGGR